MSKTVVRAPKQEAESGEGESGTWKGVVDLSAPVCFVVLKVVCNTLRMTGMEQESGTGDGNNVDDHHRSQIQSACEKGIGKDGIGKRSNDSNLGDAKTETFTDVRTGNEENTGGPYHISDRDAAARSLDTGMYFGNREETGLLVEDSTAR